MSLNKWILGLLGSLCLSNFSLMADIPEGTYSSETISEELGQSERLNLDAPSEKSYPFSLTVEFESIGKSKINKGFFEGDLIHFAQVESEASLIFYYCPAYTEGANIALSYSYTLIEWHNNPWFNQDHFNTLTLSLGGFTKRLCRWLWFGQIAINLDAEEWDLNDYATYDLILWGRYEYSRHIGIHIGLIAQTGMQMDRVYPILGADWRVSKHWKLNVVFPVNISLEYLFNKRWSLALAGRSFNVRYRVGDKESQPKNVLRYENVGVELALKYDVDNMSVNVHAGRTLGGRLRVANRHNDHPHTYHFDSANYAGAEAVVRF